jgi:hypothetical protein
MTIRISEPSDDFRSGAWSLIQPSPAWSGNSTWRDFIAYAWRVKNRPPYVVVVNYSDHQAQCRLQLSGLGPAVPQFKLVDLMGEERYIRAGSELVDPGLFIDLPAWRFNVFELEPSSL